jgi:hypothetical protein
MDCFSIAYPHIYKFSVNALRERRMSISGISSWEYDVFKPGIHCHWSPEIAAGRKLCCQLRQERAKHEPFDFRRYQ